MLGFSPAEERSNCNEDTSFFSARGHPHSLEHHCVHGYRCTERPPGSLCCPVLHSHTVHPGHTHTHTHHTPHTNYSHTMHPGLLPHEPTGLGSFHGAPGEEAALCEHPRWRHPPSPLSSSSLSLNSNFHHRCDNQTTVTLGWMASQG